MIENTILQEVIKSGDGHIYICSVYFDGESQPLGIYTGRKIRQYLPDFGVTCFGESVIEPKVLELTIEFLQKIKFKGLGTAEFAKDRIGGEYLFLELNGRSYYHNILFTDCGINLPYINYCDLTEKPCTITQSYAKSKG
jgi:predicted ATP-grasp superfamily ATP-dependent carboligase